MKQIDVQALGHLTLFFSQLLHISGITQTWTHQGCHQPRVAIYIQMNPNSINYKFSLLYWPHFQYSVVTDKWLQYRTAQTQDISIITRWSTGQQGDHKSRSTSSHWLYRLQQTMALTLESGKLVNKFLMNKNKHQGTDHWCQYCMETHSYGL